MGEGALSRRNENCTLETLPRACWVVVVVGGTSARHPSFWRALQGWGHLRTGLLTLP